MARKLVLESKGYRVLTASTAEDALGIINSEPLDLVITDHLLPSSSGGELCARLKELNPALPVIILSGSMDWCPEFDKADLFVTKGSVIDLIEGVALVLARRNLSYGVS